VQVLLGTSSIVKKKVMSVGPRSLEVQAYQSNIICEATFKLLERGTIRSWLLVQGKLFKLS